MKATKIYDQQYQWFVFGRDPEKKKVLSILINT